MTAPENPDDPVITTTEELREALLRQFLDNAWRGHDEANDALVELITARQRQQQARHREHRNT